MVRTFDAITRRRSPRTVLRRSMDVTCATSMRRVAPSKRFLETTKSSFMSFRCDVFFACDATSFRCCHKEKVRMKSLSFEISANVSTAYLILQRAGAVLKWWCGDVKRSSSYWFNDQETDERKQDHGTTRNGVKWNFSCRGGHHVLGGHGTEFKRRSKSRISTIHTGDHPDDRRSGWLRDLDCRVRRVASCALGTSAHDDPRDSRRAWTYFVG